MIGIDPSGSHLDNHMATLKGTYLGRYVQFPSIRKRQEVAPK